MSDHQTNFELNQLFISKGRCLLQYVGEAWPWASADDETERQAIEELVSRQRNMIAQLAQFLHQRDWPLEVGTYPTEYTDLQYLSLDYFRRLLVDDAQAVVSEIERTLSMCQSDGEITEMLESFLAEQKSIHAALQKQGSPATS